MFMQSETIRQGVTPVEPCTRPSSFEFEVAYQARVASDRIRFAIKHIEQLAQGSALVCEVGLQLLDALDRLDELDGQFQTRSRMAIHSRCASGMESCRG
jgi:hypothetical protein